MKLPILTVLDPTLKETSQPVTRFDAALKKLAADMMETMHAAPGIGLAAIQVGIPKRLLVMVDSREKDKRKEYVLVNPEIVGKSEETMTCEEGCLSVPDVYFEIERPARVTVRYFDLNGNERTETFADLAATVAQHEMDHLDGRDITDYMSPLKRDITLRKLRKRERNG